MPFTKCDRIADYRRAWAHFNKEGQVTGHCPAWHEYFGRADFFPL